jgi:hypothetical protein
MRKSGLQNEMLHHPPAFRTGLQAERTETHFAQISGLKPIVVDNFIGAKPGKATLSARHRTSREVTVSRRFDCVGHLRGRCVGLGPP